MTSRPLVRLLTCGSVLGVALALAPPAVAQNARDPLTRLLDGMFSRTPAETAPPPEEAVAPPPPSPAAPATGNAPTLGGAAPQAVASRPATHPLPPRRPAGLGGSDQPAAPTPTPTATAPTPAAVPAGKAVPAAATASAPAARALVPPLPATPAAALERVNRYLNSYDAITGRFIQFGADGRRAEGTLYVQRPGRLRFQYNPPSTLEIVADGRSVAVRDKKLRTNDVYSIGQTPLKFLLKDRIDLASDMKLIDVVNNPDGVVRVTLEDSATLGGTSRITLMFDAKNNTLKQWTVLDPQGYETSVALYDLDVTLRP